ncbi:hypothetical protein B5F53_11915 [Blautia sp. An249]|uniref:hypothetical protein n=1 Tax=Blautia sp. An249 TaxID=1965603 RepID=UPI000B377F13|nr:hypothetical protein [Blautia sp. An249]OUO77914.1 hypothetical protein B5F53_11915 [Blautia sp. An249]
MNLIEKWKNRETKKSLREENIRLKAQVEMLHRVKPPVCTVERNVQRIRSALTIRQDDIMTADYAKEKVKHGLLQYISPFIDWDIEDDYETGNKILTGTLYVATGDRRHNG